MAVSWFEQLFFRKRMDRAEELEARAAKAEQEWAEFETEDERQRRELAIECERARTDARHANSVPVRPLRLASLPNIDIESE